MRALDAESVTAHRIVPLLAWTLGAAVFLPSPAARAEASAPVEAFDHQHAAWTRLLTRYVQGDEVDYAGLKRDGGPELNAYLRKLAGVSAEAFGRFEKNQRLAYWINAYNAYTLELVLAHYPLKSIRSAGAPPFVAFRKKFISLRHLGEKKISLNHIEHEVLRKEFSEPRIHFAIVCASRSCPALRPEAFVASKIDAQLEQQARGFINDARRNRVSADGAALHLSRIFDWFREDFERDGRSLASFVAKYLPPKLRKRAAAGKIEVTFLEYDWSLNGT